MLLEVFLISALSSVVIKGDPINIKTVINSWFYDSFVFRFLLSLHYKKRLWKNKFLNFHGKWMWDLPSLDSFYDEFYLRRE